MRLKRIGILFFNEFRQGAKNYMFVIAILTPLVLTVVVTLFFGGVFSQKPKLGIVDEGESRHFFAIEESELLSTKRFPSVSRLKSAVEAGSMDAGVIIPNDFDLQIDSGEKVEIIVYIWGESLSKDRAMIHAVLSDLLREMTGRSSMVEITPIALGEEEAVSWKDRFFPMIVMVTIFMGGMMIPAASLVEDKQKQTLRALTVTPVSLAEVCIAKGAAGFAVSLFMGFFILILNQALDSLPLLMIIFLILGSALAATLGILLGAFIKEANTLFFIIKPFGLILYFPALIYIFPQIPAWLGRFFPTYYLIDPIIKISRNQAGSENFIPDFLLLAGVILCLWGVLFMKLRMKRQIEF